MGQAVGQYGEAAPDPVCRLRQDASFFATRVTHRTIVAVPGAAAQ
jgi:hypothetical protein